MQLAELTYVADRLAPLENSMNLNAADVNITADGFGVLSRITSGGTRLHRRRKDVRI